MPINNIDNKYIDEAITNLVETFGINENIKSDGLINLLKQNKIKTCIEKIADYLGLPISINIDYVPAGYQPVNSNSQQASFASKDLVETDGSGRGKDSITAQVNIPPNLPLYGTPRFNQFPINVKISENCRNHKKTFLAIMAHELSHIVLHSTWHKEKNNEIYTDLTAMILGFSKIVSEGRKISNSFQEGNIIHTNTTTYGYLNDHSFWRAYYRIEKVLKDQRKRRKKILKKVKQYNKLLNRYNKGYLLFKNYSEYLKNHKNVVFKKKDTQKIIDFFQPPYEESLKSGILNFKKVNRELESWVTQTKHYHLADLSKKEKYIIELLNSLTTSLRDFRKDYKILKKYISAFYKIKTNFLSINED